MATSSYKKDGETGNSRKTKRELKAEEEAALQYAKLDALGQTLAKKRSEAIEARQSSGIEEIWLEDEEYYEGIDEKNRNAEGNGTWRQKPPGQIAVGPKGTTQSTVFPNITGAFTDAASARITDMLMPNDERAWEIAPTPIPDLMEMSKGMEPKGFAAAPTQPAPQPPGMPPQPGMEEQPPGPPPPPPLSPEEEKQLALKQAADEEMAKAQRSADLASDQIEDWHIDCQYNANVRQVIEDAARIGVGVLKGPVPYNRRKISYRDGAMVIENEIVPRSKWIDPWNFFPDGACGENIHNGSYTWERDYITTRQLIELAEDSNYIKEQIVSVLNEGSQKATSIYTQRPEGDVKSPDELKGKFERWTYHGLVEPEELEIAGCDCSDMSDLDRIPAVITLVNSRVIKASINPLDTGDFPYDAMVWRRRAGHWTGIGVARQIRTPQKMIVGSTRHLMDNAGIAAGPMLIFKQGSVSPVDGKMGFAPRKVFYVAEDSEVIDDVRKAIGTIKVDMVIDELLKIIQLGMRFAEDTTGLPMLLQGQMGSAPDTVGGMSMLNNNATAVLRRMARTFDDRVTAPHIRRYYTWLLQYGDNDEAKGEYTILAKASSAMVERSLQSQEIVQMAQIVTDVRFGADPKKWFHEFLISRHFDPSRFELTDKEWEENLKKLSAPPPDSRLDVAQINAESRNQIAQLQAEIAAMKEQGRQQIEQMSIENESNENMLDRERDVMIAKMEKEYELQVESMRESGMNQRVIEQLKQKLADTTLKLRTQRDLSAAEVIQPAVEPKGRASANNSFTE